MKFFQKHSKRGFTLLLAVLISSILIGLGSAIFDIISKEIVLSSSGRESQFAFYAADTGVECALYWDSKQDAFSTSSVQSSVSCGGSSVPVDRTVDNGGTQNEVVTTTFSFPLDGGIKNPCADVKVVRTYYPKRTTVESLGYNTCDTSSSVRLERAIRATF